MKRAVLLVDHGSRLPEANALLEQIAALLRQRLPGRLVRIAHMELAPPSIGEAIDTCVAEGVGEVLVHPFFLAPGRHSHHDIPERVREAAAHHPGLRARISGPLGAHPALVEVILERLEEVGP